MTIDALKSGFSFPIVRLVFLLQLALGVLLAFGTPSLVALDELYHWQRSVQISEGHLLARHAADGQFGGNIDRGAFDYYSWYFDKFVAKKPILVADAWREARALAPESAQRVSIGFPSTATFTPIAYLPQATGIAVSRMVGGNLFTQIIAGRIANLIAFLLVVGLTYRILPGGRLFFLVAMFIPTSLHLASSLSADPVNFALPALLIAYCMRLRADVDFELTTRRRRLIAALVIVCGLLKLMYVLFALPILLIPAAKFASMRSRWLFIGVCLGASIAISATWNLVYPFVPGIYWGNGANPSVALHAILTDPLHAIDTVSQSLYVMWFDWFRGYFGAIGGEGGFAYFIPNELLLPAIYLMAALTLVDRMPHRDVVQSGLFAAVAALFIAALLAAFLIGFTKIGAPLVEGINGRYFFLFYLLAGWAVLSLRPLGSRLTVLRLPLFCGAVGLEAYATLTALRFFQGLWIY